MSISQKELRKILLKHFFDYFVYEQKARCKAIELIKDLQIQQIEIERSVEFYTLYLWLARPGLLIGYNGKRWDSLVKYIEERVDKKIELRVFEKSGILDELIISAEF